MQVFIVVCLVVELWMVPLVLAVMFLVQYGLVYGKGRHLWQQRAKRRSSASSSELVIGQPLAEVGMSEACMVGLDKPAGQTSPDYIPLLLRHYPPQYPH